MNLNDEIEMYRENKRIKKIININYYEVGSLEYTCNNKSCNFVHIKYDDNLKFIKRINDIDGASIKKHGNTIVFKSYGLNEKIIYNTKLRKSIRVTNAKYIGEKDKYECYIDAYSDDSTDRAYFILDANSMKTNGFYSKNQGIFIPIYKDEDYINDEFYKSLDSYDKFVRRMKDTFEDKIYDNLSKKNIDENKCLIKRMKVC